MQAYGRLAAAALDSAAALEETRSQATRAEALLTLSSALAEIASTEDMAQRIARAVPSVIDCDRAIVVVAESPSVGRIAGVYGYPGRHRRHPPGPERSPSTATSSRRDDSARPAGTARADPGVHGLDRDRRGGVVPHHVERPGPRLHHRQRHQPARAAHRFRRPRGEAPGSGRTSLHRAQQRHAARPGPPPGAPRRAHRPAQSRPHPGSCRADAGESPPRRAATAAFFIDLDNFKTVNDTLGHGAGDQLLKAVANRLSAAIRANDTVGRLGGDEFVVLAEGTSLDGGPELVAARLLDVLSEPFELAGFEGIPLTTSASIGIATGQRTTADDLLRDADIALYRAKAAGKACAVVFESYMQSEVLDRLRARARSASEPLRAVLRGVSTDVRPGHLGDDRGRRPSCGGTIPAAGSCCRTRSFRSSKTPG